MAKIENTQVYGIEDSFRASKFPFAVDVKDCFDMKNWNYWKIMILMVLIYLKE